MPIISVFRFFKVFSGNGALGKKSEKRLNPWHMGTHLRVLSESYPINNNLTGFRWISKTFKALVLWTKVALALEGLNGNCVGVKVFNHLLKVDFLDIPQRKIRVFRCVTFEGLVSCDKNTNPGLNPR